MSWRYAKRIRFYPNAAKLWSFTEVQLLMNNLLDFCQPDRSRLHDSGLYSRITLKFVNRSNSKSVLYFTYLIMTAVVEMEATIDWLLDNWEKHVVEKTTFIGSQQRKSVRAITRAYRYYTLSIDVTSDTSFAILNSLNPIYYNRTDFSPCYHGFVSYFCRCKHIPWFRDNIDFSFMYEYYEIFLSKNVNKNETTYECFAAKNQGYFKFIISEWTESDNKNRS